MSEHLVLIGAFGWEHPQWDTDYYPDDLPPEWRLGFYGNEFPVVLIPAAAWQQGESAVQAWLDETHETPRFIAQWPVREAHAGDYERTLAMLQRLGERLLAVYIRLTESPAARLQGYLQKLEQLAPLVLDTAAADNPQQLADRVQLNLQQPASRVWHGGADARAVLAPGKLAIACVDESMSQPRALRGVVESLLAGSVDKTHVVLLFAGAPPSIKQMRAAGVILDLL